jgi:signal transduction histidine kinase
MSRVMAGSSLAKTSQTVPHARLARRLAGGLSRLLEILPQRPAVDRVVYRARLVWFVSAVAGAALVVAVAGVRVPTDSATLAAGGAVIFLMALYAIRALPPVSTNWSPGVFVHIGLSVTLGPIGALTGAAADAAGVAIRTRNGWFRSLFNLANIFLANMAAWAVFSSARGVLGGSASASLLAGLCAGVAQYAVNHGLLAVVVRLANQGVDLIKVVRTELEVLPYSIGYGLAAFTFVEMHALAGTVGFIALLVPVILLHGFLVLFARRVHVYEAQRTAHQKEREELLQKAVDASEAERRRIARDLHDGVVQNLAGMAFTLMATASQLKEQGAENGNGELLEVIEQSADETRSAMKDLRTLIIEIAPPTLRREGLHAALLEIVKTLKTGGTRTRLELPSNMRLRQDRASLIFRVAQEVLRNVAAHAEAKHVSVVLKESGGTATLRIVDDGKGFSAEDVARRRAEGHVGTSGIIELAEDAGGTLKIDSEPNRGTRVTLTVPTE